MVIAYNTETNNLALDRDPFMVRIILSD